MERQVPVSSGRLTAVSARPSGTPWTQAAGPDETRSPRNTGRQPEIGPEIGSVPDLPEMPDTATLVRELNHRVKNNFQIITSLMNLRKRMMPPDRREDIRFIEEHVQSMSVAYRLVYATGSMVEVSLIELITEVLSGLRQSASLGEEQLRIDAPDTGALIGLDNAIALALYLAVLLPPYLDEAIATTGTVTVSATVVANDLGLSVRGTWAHPIKLDVLRARLMQAYAAQLKAKISSATAGCSELLRFALEAEVPIG